MKRRGLLTGLLAAPALLVPSLTSAKQKNLGWTISTKEDHPGYVTWKWLHAHGQTVKDVYVDGIKLHGCSTACQKEGYAVCATYDANGDIIYVRPEGHMVIEKNGILAYHVDEGYFPEVTHYGEVTFEFEEWPSPYRYKPYQVGYIRGLDGNTIRHHGGKSPLEDLVFKEIP